MRIALTDRALKSLQQAPLEVRKAFYKQIGFLEKNLNHPSLQAKKYDEAADLWQGRVNRSWRFYFVVENHAYLVVDVIPHSK